MHSIVSSIIFSLALLWPEFSIVTMGSFLIPLCFKKQKIWDGLLWGTIVFLTYWFWLLILFKKYCVGIIGYIFYVAFIAWCATLSSIWLYFFDKAPVAATTIFFWFITKFSMIITGSFEGMPLINPLVLLADYPMILSPLPWIGDIGMFLILFGIQSWAAIEIKNKNIKRFLGYCLILLSLQLISFYFQEDTSKRMPGVSIIIPWWYQKGDGMFCGYRLSHDICKEIHSKNLLPKIILTPESTFSFDLDEYKNFIPIWCESANNVPILLAGHYYKNKMTHNCIFLLHNNKILYQYFKQHRVPFLERSLWFEKLLWSPILSSELILNTQDEDGIDTKNKEDRIQIENQYYQLFLCSEFFFEAKQVLGQPILLLWNDTWLCCDYAKKLAQLFMKYFEKKYRVDVYHLATSGVTNISF